MQLDLRRPVAIKVIAADRSRDPQLRSRFALEARLAASIDHPNLVPVHAAGEQDGRLYLVMRYVGGTDLHRELKSRGRLSPARAAGVVAQLAAGLDAAHAAGLVHRDVKPANVLLAGEHVYLADFGLSRLQSSDARFTDSGAWVGTVDYMSPEHLRGEPCDARSDVYALGCVLFSALSGQAPFRRDTVPATMSAHLHEPSPLVTDVAPVPAEFDAVIARALAKAPEDRFPSAGDLGRAALAAASGEPVTEEERTVATGAAAPPDAPTAAMVTTALPRRGALAFLTGAAAAAVVGAVLVVRAEPDLAASTSGPLSEGDVRSAVEQFSEAVGTEDAGGLSRVLARDVKRVFPADSQLGRGPVLDAYRTQFRENDISGYKVSDLDVSGGRAGRAEGRYELAREGRDEAGGDIVFGVTRERGRAKIALIAAKPD